MKIVGGPLKGAEIALVAGTRVKVGSGDGCDILVADSTLGKAAFELDVGEDEVTITTPDGAAKTMLDYEAWEFGSSAFAVGAAEGAWPEIVWPGKESEEGSGKSEEGRGKSEEMPSGKAEDARPETEDGTGGEKEPARGSRLMVVVLAAVAVALVLIALLCLRSCRNCGAELGESSAPCATLAGVAQRYGLAVVETNGQSVIRGDLKCRSERLAATAEAFQAQPGVEVDLSDDESLLEAAEALVSMVAGDSLKVVGATNRVIALKGKVASQEALRGILGALDRDVPCVSKVDCAQVVCDFKPVAMPIVSLKDLEPMTPERRLTVPRRTDETEEAEAVRQEVRVVPEAPVRSEAPVPAPAARRGGNGKTAAPRLPLCGILTVPYPCIILKDGARVSEGGEFGGYVVEKIGADALTLRSGKRTFEWKP